LRFSWQNTAISGFKMSLFGAVWLADLNGDQPFLPISEKNTCFDHHFMLVITRIIFLECSHPMYLKID
jgi:hypothetical protein